jgi:hypothetical protein
MKTDAGNQQLLSALLCVMVAAIAASGCVSSEERQHRRDLKARADHTTGRSSTCPAHHLVMQAKTVPIEYGLIIATRPEPSAEVRKQRFPYSTDWIAGGCIVSDGYPKTAKLYLCPSCVRAEQVWYSAHPKRK